MNLACRSGIILYEDELAMLSYLKYLYEILLHVYFYIIVCTLTFNHCSTQLCFSAVVKNFKANQHQQHPHNSEHYNFLDNGLCKALHSEKSIKDGHDSAREVPIF